MVTWCAQYTLDHWDNASCFEQFCLLRILFKHSCKSEALYGPFAIVICRRLNSNVRWVSSLAIFDCEEARLGRSRRAQAEEDVEQGA